MTLAPPRNFPPACHGTAHVKTGGIQWPQADLPASQTPRPVGTLRHSSFLFNNPAAFLSTRLWQEESFPLPLPVSLSLAPYDPASQSPRAILPSLLPSPFIMAERILMNEYKTLAKEPWVNIEVCVLPMARHGSCLPGPLTCLINGALVP